MNNSSLIELLNKTIINIESDYLATAIAAGLIQHNICPENIIHKPCGTSARSYKKNVSKIHSQENEKTGITQFFLYTNTESIYDGLPEHIFHQSKGEVCDISTEIKRFRNEEIEARKFFSPFEQELFQIRLKLYILEEKTEAIGNLFALVNIFKSCWPILNRLDIKQGYLFLLMLPKIHYIRGNFTFIKECLTLLLKYPIQIDFIASPQLPSIYTLPALNDGLLGINTIIGNSSYDEEQGIQISIGPLTATEIALFHDTKSNLIEELCDYFIDACYVVSVCYLYQEGSEKIGMGSDRLRLGLSCFL